MNGTDLSDVSIDRLHDVCVMPRFIFCLLKDIKALSLIKIDTTLSSFFSQK